MSNLADFLRTKGLLEREEDYLAFCKIDRADFVLDNEKEYADEDTPLAIRSEEAHV